MRIMLTALLLLNFVLPVFGKSDVIIEVTTSKPKVISLLTTEMRGGLPHPWNEVTFRSVKLGDSYSMSFQLADNSGLLEVPHSLLSNINNINQYSYILRYEKVKSKEKTDLFLIVSFSHGNADEACQLDDYRYSYPETTVVYSLLEETFELDTRSCTE